VSVNAAAPQHAFFWGSLSGLSSFGSATIVPEMMGNNFLVLSVPYSDLFMPTPSFAYAYGLIPTGASTPIGGVGLTAGGDPLIAVQLAGDDLTLKTNNGANVMVNGPGMGMPSTGVLLANPEDFTAMSQTTCQTTGTWQVGPVAQVDDFAVLSGILDDGTLCGDPEAVVAPTLFLQSYSTVADTLTLLDTRMVGPATAIGGMSAGAPGWVVSTTEVVSPTDTKIHADRLTGSLTDRYVIAAPEGGKATGVATAENGEPIVAMRFNGSVAVGSGNGKIGGGAHNAGVLQIDVVQKSARWSFVLSSDTFTVFVDAVALSEDKSQVLIAGRFADTVPQVLNLPGVFIPQTTERTFVAALCP
jgi:hypothetical protein